jgi:hypothetical protein
MLETVEGECACGQFTLEIGRHFDFSVLSGGDIQGFDHPTRGCIRGSRAFHVLPQFPPIGIGQ